MAAVHLICDGEHIIIFVLKLDLVTNAIIWMWLLFFTCWCVKVSTYLKKLLHFAQCRIQNRVQSDLPHGINENNCIQILKAIQATTF